MRFRFWESSLHKFVASSLQVLCISCNFLDSSLQVLCKFLEKFLAKSLQEFSAGGRKLWKIGPKMVPKSIYPRSSRAGRVGANSDRRMGDYRERTDGRALTDGRPTDGVRRETDEKHRSRQTAVGVGGIARVPIDARRERPVLDRVLSSDIAAGGCKSKGL